MGKQVTSSPDKKGGFVVPDIYGEPENQKNHLFSKAKMATQGDVEGGGRPENREPPFMPTGAQETPSPSPTVQTKKTTGTSKTTKTRNPPKGRRPIMICPAPSPSSVRSVRRCPAPARCGDHRAGGPAQQHAVGMGVRLCRTHVRV